MDDSLTARGVSVSYGARPALRDIDLVLAPGRITALVGPNGCGKSTLLRTLRGLQRPDRGRVELEAEDVLRLSERALARRIALLAQSPAAPDDLTVFGLVRLGRYPHQSFLRQWSAEDAGAVDAAIAATGLADLRDRRLDTLSGGQRQRVWIAMAVAQDADVLCLDEPINHLDLAHQIECLELVRRLSRKDGKTVAIVLHDLNVAARYADDLVAMREGRVIAAGPPETLITERLVREVFGVESRVIRDPVHGRPLCIPLGLRSSKGEADRLAAE